MEKTTIEVLDLIENWIEQKKGYDVIKIDVRDKVNYADYIFICTAQSELHVKAIAEHAIESASKENIYVQGKEGMQSANWVLVDFSDIILHIFTPQAREYYNLENLWN